MSRLLFALFALLAAVSIIAASPTQCGPNEVWKSCGTACPPTCKNPEPKNCPTRCVPHCECNRGYLRNSALQCVLPKDCPKNHKLMHPKDSLKEVDNKHSLIEWFSDVPVEELSRIKDKYMNPVLMFLKKN